ncbi:MAG: hypothetical protein WKG00_04805 [Polyangiaceae bacterium]
MSDIVQLDIVRASRRTIDRFVLWPGHRDNRIEVEGIDRPLQQLVLLVHEPRRRFEVAVDARRQLAPGLRVVRQQGSQRIVEQFTAGSKRHFLCGMDEQHPFIARLPEPVSTVRAAHRALLDPRVTVAERGALDRTIRQGEWFFVALAPHRERVLDELLKHGALVRRSVGIAQAAGIRRVGRPHIADEVLVVAAETPGHPPAAYVRGAVRHPDHRTVVFHHFRQVIPNRESVDQPVPGVRWID